MNITVCSFENRTQSELYKIVHENHEEYCAKHGYRYYEVNDFSKWPSRDHAVWYKFNLIEEAMESSDYIFYIDFDAVFTNFDKYIENIIDPSTYNKILIAKDCNGGRDIFDYGWNIGVMLIPVLNYTKQFVSLMTSDLIYTIFNALQQRRIITFREQSAFEFLFENVPEFMGMVQEVPRNFI